MKILVISNNYPSAEFPTYGTFVYNIVQQFMQLGHEVSVIAVRSIWKTSVLKKVNGNYGEELATVYRPFAISASNKWVLGYNTHHIGEMGQVRAVKNTVKKHNITFDVVYAHFLVNGIVAVKALSKYGRPIMVAEGELKNINLRKAYYRPRHYAHLISKIEGVIAVSPQIKENLIEVGINSKRITICPNGIDPDRFYKRDKNEMRKKYNLPLEKKLVIFVGRFVEDKGPLRVLKAVSDLQNINLIFVGSGNQDLQDDKIVFKDKVQIEFVPELLSAADLFVLPTLHEGSCNAIVEAMACGLPIVSSDIPEIRFQCDPSFSMLVNPMDVKAIRKAIDDILSDKTKLDQMSENAMEYSKKFDITQRAKNILAFIEKKVDYRN